MFRVVAHLHVSGGPDSGNMPAPVCQPMPTHNLNSSCCHAWDGLGLEERGDQEHGMEPLLCGISKAALLYGPTQQAVPGVGRITWCESPLWVCEIDAAELQAISVQPPDALGYFTEQALGRGHLCVRQSGFTCRRQVQCGCRMAKQLSACTCQMKRVRRRLHSRELCRFTAQSCRSWFQALHRRL